MRKLELVTLKYPSKLCSGIFVVPESGSGQNFTIGVVNNVIEESPYVKVNIDNEEIELIHLKLQPVKLYLVEKSPFEPGDWFYTPAKKNPPSRHFGRFDAGIGRINKELDAKLYTLSLSKKIIYKPESIALVRSTSELYERSIGDLIPIDSGTLKKILENSGECWIEDELIDNKVVIHYEPIR